MPDGFTSRDGIELGTVTLLMLAYLRDRRKDRITAKEVSDKALSEGAAKHQQNSAKLQNLEEFNERQTDINARRDRQLTELMVQTGRLTEIALATNRRLEMLEERK